MGRPLTSVMSLTFDEREILKKGFIYCTIDVIYTQGSVWQLSRIYFEIIEAVSKQDEILCQWIKMYIILEIIRP
jgi:hypothetical protein